MEEAHELLERIQNKGVLPQITSCSPGWINYLEYYYPEVIPHVSTCKSPHMMVGAIVKSYFAKTHNIDPKDIFVVSIMPCVAKKYERSRSQMPDDVDAVLTTRELAKLIKRSGINWQRLPEEEFDQDLLGEYTGAGVIFGVTGGVMEAALRTAYFWLTGKEHEKIDFEQVRGLEGVKEAALDINGTVVKVAVCSGMKNAKALLEEIKAGKSPYAFVEIMCCPGGCINGGGQPFVKPLFLPNEDDNILETYKAKRASVLYQEDKNKAIRQSHNNKDIQKLYKEFLGKPGSELAEELLHTSYDAHREKFPDNK
jgi:NADP-reducing hydrogenase subunit HndD